MMEIRLTRRIVSGARRMARARFVRRSRGNDFDFTAELFERFSILRMPSLRRVRPGEQADIALAVVAVRFMRKGKRFYERKRGTKIDRRPVTPAYSIVVSVFKTA
jgi:hypothetical protein